MKYNLYNFDIYTSVRDGILHQGEHSDVEWVVK